ncbi:lipoprotein [Streptomyces geranii]|uniref:lipoprotein n=1 Tax=Streptomyces geranii TaxID=2058923 RepID=UPI000D0482A1|nr:lipoprotein [Streptomyces geranii]
MLVGAGNAGRGLVLAALLTAALTGCTEAPDKEAKPTSSATKDDASAESGSTIGAAGSACELPVTFDTAEKWTAEAVDGSLSQGPVSLACEVDAKPAGHIGFLRAWTADPGAAADARTLLQAFVTADKGASKAKYTEFTTNGLTGAEVQYVYSDEFQETPKKERALAVTTPRGSIVVHLGGLDTEEHEAMLPAYELAKSTLKP